MQFEYYVLNYNFNKHKVEMFNIFKNINIQEDVERLIRRYLRSPNKFTYCDYDGTNYKYGFDALCEEIKRTIKWQEFGRREYEISVSDAFEQDIDNLEKWDCYMQCEPNIEIITREVIYQYKQQNKKGEE